MKKTSVLTVVLILVAMLLGFMLGRSFCPITQAIRQAQNLTTKGVEGKKQALGILNRQNAAIELALKKVHLEETRKTIAVSLGKVLIEHEMWLEAEKYLQEAYSLLPGDFSINLNLGITYSSLFRLEGQGLKRNEYQKKAFQHLNAALTARPDNADVHYLLGMLYYYDKQPEQAYTHFRKVLDLYPDDVKSLLALARILYDSGDVEAARKIYLKLENQLPANHPKMKQIQENLRLLDEAGLDG